MNPPSVQLLNAFRYIYERLRSIEFSNTEIIYPYEGKDYPIQVIHNPNHEVLWGLCLGAPLFQSLIMVGDLPLALQHHIGDISAKFVNPAECFFYLAGHFFDLSGSASLRAVKDLAPAYTTTQIDDSEIEKAIKQLFRSPIFATQVFNYFIDGKYYRVRLLVNPELRQLTAKRPWTIKIDGVDISGVSSVYWQRKYGIMADRPCPKELISYLSRLADMSCWDWYMHFEIKVGERVTFNGYSDSRSTKITLSEAWFNCAQYLE